MATVNFQNSDAETTQNLTNADNSNFEEIELSNSHPVQVKPAKPRPSIISLSALRQQWDKPIEFLLSCIAMSVGLGNIWRFPYVAYENGGGAFLIPYLAVLFFIGKPIYFLEMVIGQFSSQGQVKVWKMSPIFKGVGFGSAFASACVLSYYCSLMALTVFYFIGSFSKTLPWSVCDPKWETDYNVSCSKNETLNKSIPELYFKLEVLREKDSIDDGIGLPDWRLALCLLFAWIVIFTSLIKGVKSAGKVAYFTALFPYFVLIILLIRGVTLEGAWKGIYYFVKPEWSKLLEGRVWAAAISQCFFSLSVGFGPIIMFSSYNPFTHNVYRDAMIISLTDTVTSLLAGFTIFGILGNLAHQLDVDIKDVAGKGAGLAFVSYPQAIAQFKVLPQLFSVLFFGMLLTLGVGSATSLAGGLITIIQDQFPKIDKRMITTIVSILGYLSGLVYITPGGQWMLELVDYFGASFLIYVMATLEIVGIVWVYGLSNLCRDVEFMLSKQMGKGVSLYWKFCWAVLIPLVLFGVLIQSLIQIKDGVFHDEKPYPISLIVFGWALALFGFMLVPFSAVHSILKSKGNTLTEKFIESFKPTEDWGPASLTRRREWKAFSESRETGPNLMSRFRHIKQLVKKS